MSKPPDSSFFNNFWSFINISLACLLFVYFLFFQSPSDNQDNLVKKLTSYMKEKDRALQVRIQLPSFVLFLIATTTSVSKRKVPNSASLIINR